MQIETFKVFCDLVETGSFSGAAEANKITQSAVSQQIQALEERFGAPLVERGRRKIALTPAGEAFLETVRAVLHLLESLDTKLQKVKTTVSGELLLTSVLSIGLHELPPCLREFRANFPGVNIRVDYQRSSQVYTSVQEGRSDLGLVAYPAIRRGLEMRTFWRDRLVLVCLPDHPLARRRKISLSMLQGERFVAFENDLPTRKFIDRKLADEGVKVRVVFESDHVETIKRTVENEGSLSIIPLTAVQNELRSGSLKAIPIEAENMWRPLGVLFKKGRIALPPVREFLSLLEDFDLGGEGKARVKASV